MVGLDDFLDGYQAPRTTVVVTARADLLAEHQALQARINLAAADDVTLGGSPEIGPLAEQIAALEEDIAASSMAFTFQSIGRRAWMALVAEHPPRQEDRDLDYNAETFPEAAVAACAIEPPLTEKEVRRLAEVLSLSQWMKLWQGALAANLGDDAAPKSVIATAVRRRSAASSITAPPEASPAASSSDES